LVSPAKAPLPSVLRVHIKRHGGDCRALCCVHPQIDNEGLDSDFSSLDAQKEACEAYVASQRAEGWVLVDQSYDDGGFSGGKAERPALQRLMADIERGEVNAVIVHRVDRLSRSLLDFSGMMRCFQEHDVSFVSVTQQFNTASSMGRMVLNLLLTFAQFEREMIAERTSDKMCAARRKGKWMGGPPILGYDPDRENHRLIVNPDEAEMVRELFDLYLRYQSTLKVVEELNRRGWTTKVWLSKGGIRHGGSRWDKARLIRHLTNVTYTGKVLHDNQVYEGEHEGIIDPAIFQQVQEQIARNSNGCSPAVRNKHGGLLRGLIRCAKCGAAMAHTYTKKKNGRLYRYYACNTRTKQGREACDTRALPAADVEAFVVQQIRQIGRDPQLVEQVYAEAQKQQADIAPRIKAEYDQLLPQRRQCTEEIKGLVAAIAKAEQPAPSLTESLHEAEERAAALDQRLTELKSAATEAESQTIDADHLRDTLRQLDPLWDVLHPAERIELVHQVVEVVRYNADDDTISVTLRHNAPDQPADRPILLEYRGYHIQVPQIQGLNRHLRSQTIDADGIALAAIQALYKRNLELESKLFELQGMIGKLLSEDQ
jgi:site-specific DNA recombinase